MPGNSNLVQNKIHKYDSLMYPNGPVSVDSLLSNKSNDIHQQIFENAISEFFKEHKELDRENYQCIEIKSQEYWMPSQIILVSKNYPFKKTKHSLQKYWNTSYIDKHNKTYQKLYIDDDTLKDASLVYIDYVADRAKLKSRMTGVEFSVPLERINRETPISEEYSTGRTFSSLYKKVRNY